MSDRTPPPPDELVAAMRRALDDNPSPTAADTLEAAERLLDQVLRTDCESRAAALDLLTLDALMTQAVELGARDDQLADEFFENAMRLVAGRAKT